MFDSFCSYQAALLTEFDRLSAEFNFQMVDAAADARTICAHLQQNILQLLERDSRKNFISRLSDDSTTAQQPTPHAALQEKSQERERAAKLPDTALFAVAAPVAKPSTNGNGHHAAHHGQ
jgi:hypothetical protein